METTEPGMEHYLDISKFLDLKNSSYSVVEKKYCNIVRLLRMLTEGLHTDATINANDGSVRAHKSVLVSVSPVFQAMFMQEQLTSTVNFPDISIQGLQLFLVLVYVLNDNIVAPREFEKSINDHFDELYEACCKYQVRNLEPTMTANLKCHLTPENCWQYYHTAAFVVSNRESTFVDKVQSWILKHFSEVREFHLGDSDTSEGCLELLETTLAIDSQIITSGSNIFFTK